MAAGGADHSATRPFFLKKYVYYIKNPIDGDAFFSNQQLIDWLIDFAGQSAVYCPLPEIIDQISRHNWIQRGRDTVRASFQLWKCIFLFVVASREAARNIND